MLKFDLEKVKQGCPIIGAQHINACYKAEFVGIDENDPIYPVIAKVYDQWGKEYTTHRFNSNGVGYNNAIKLYCNYDTELIGFINVYRSLDGWMEVDPTIYKTNATAQEHKRIWNYLNTYKIKCFVEATKV